MPKYDIVEDACKYCWGKSFMSKSFEPRYYPSNILKMFLSFFTMRLGLYFVIIWEYDNNIDEFQDFFDRHAGIFVDAPPKPAEEQNLEYYDVYQRYLTLYESNLSDYISKLDCSIEDFYEQLMAVQDDPSIKDKKLKHFVNYLIASTDYNSFYKIIVRAAKKIDKADEKSSTANISSTGIYDDRASSDAKEYSRYDDSKGSK